MQVPCRSVVPFVPAPGVRAAGEQCTRPYAIGQGSIPRSHRALIRGKLRAVKHPMMRTSSWVLLAASVLLHLGLLVGWRWQLPLVPYFFDSTVLSGGRGLDFYAVYQAGYNARHG